MLPALAAAAGSTRWRWIGAGVAVSAVLALLGWQELRVASADRKAAQADARAAAVERAAGERLLQAHLAARGTESQWAAQSAKARDSYATHLAAARRRDVDLAATRLRFDGADPGARLGVPAPAGQTCDRAAATERQLLGEADRLAEEFATAADRHADELRLCLDAWPVDSRSAGAGGPSVSTPTTE
jgi:hypothetical protein